MKYVMLLRRAYYEWRFNRLVTKLSRTKKTWDEHLRDMTDG